MSHSASKIWIHAIWTTKEKRSLISPEIELLLFSVLAKLLDELGCPSRIISGMSDHVHCLFLLNPQRSVADVVKHLKGSSSHFVNFENLVEEKFSWQKGYLAFSVSDSGLEKVVEYIKFQKEYHQNRSFEMEHNELLRMHGVYPSVSTG